MSFDDGAKYYSDYQQSMSHDAISSMLSPERGRVPVSSHEILLKDNGLHHYQPTQLSPLSEFDPTSESDSNIDFDYSPASMSSLPSSINSAAAYRHTFYQNTPHAQLRHAQSLNNLHVTAMEQAADTAKTDYYAYHQPAAIEAEQAQALGARRPSRLPQFLKDRQQQQGAADRMRPQSMMELNQLYTAHAQPQVDDYEDTDHGVVSPIESVPSSAGGLQRRRQEKDLEEQYRLFREEKKRMSKSAVDRKGSAEEAKDREKRQIIRQRSRSMCATDRLPRPGPEVEESEATAARPKSGRVEQPRSTSLGGHKKAESERDGHSVSSKELSTSGSTSGLARQSTLLTSGANPARRSKELDRLLAPNAKKSAAIASMPIIAGSPTPSMAAAFTPSTQHPASESSSRSVPIALGSSPIMLEQGQTASKARVELDLLLASSVVVEGGVLKGSMKVRVRRPNSESNEVWVGYPKVRVVGFEGALNRNRLSPEA